MSKLKSVVKMIGIAKRLQKVQHDGDNTGSSKSVESDGSGIFGSKKLIKKAKELSAKNPTRRINTRTNLGKNEKDKRQRIDARKHENLVDQVRATLAGVYGLRWWA
jgi:hypothetical protein